MKRLISIVALIAIAWSANAQSSSLNTYSPYSFYGIGDLSQSGSVMLRSMGGAGIAYRNGFRTNTMNPASYSAISLNSALFSAGFENRNFYLNDSQTTSSFNTMNIRNITFHIPIVKRLGFAFSATPYSEVGYRVSIDDPSAVVGSEIGHVRYNYEGSGGMMQFKAGLGWGITPNLSIGAEAVYYHGNVSRTFLATPMSITGTGVYNPVSGYTDEIVNTFLGNFGLQYAIDMSENSILVLGATYTMGGRMKGEIEKYISSNDMLLDTVRYGTGLSTMNLPQKVATGAFVYTEHITAGLDWEYATWSNGNASNQIGGVTFRNTNSFRAGLQWTPNPGDVRRVLRRWSYRIGARYDNYYMTINDRQINDMAITFGVGIPIGTMRLSNIDIGFEVGQRGGLREGILRERYFGVSIGISFFGDDYWFMKRKYD